MRCATRSARYPADSPLTLDPELLRKRTNDNPVFYVQYAHARTHHVGRERRGIRRRPHAPSRPSCSTHETESRRCSARSQDFPRIVAQAAELREPHRVARYLEELAGLYHRWYDNCRVIPLGDEPVDDLHRTRLWLNDATGTGPPQRLWDCWSFGTDQNVGHAPSAHHQTPGDHAGRRAGAHGRRRSSPTGGCAARSPTASSTRSSNRSGCSAGEAHVQAAGFSALAQLATGRRST